MLEFLTLEDHASPEYTGRTIENVEKADITMAFAINFGTSGEKLTRNTADRLGKEYIPIDVRELGPESAVTKAVDAFARIDHKMEAPRPLVINIAGNGIYTMKGFTTQQECNRYMYRFFSGLQQLLLRSGNRIRKGTRGFTVRSGGQTGFDQAGLVAAIALDIRAHGLYPNRYRIRPGDMAGTDRYMNHREEVERILLQEAKMLQFSINQSVKFNPNFLTR